jgi:PAS domain S-box-containing protein
VESEHEFRVIWKDGSIRWIRSRAFPILNDEGQVYRICGLDADITERMEQEAALRESQEIFTQLTDTIEDVFWMFDLGENKRVFVSPGFTESLDVDWEEGSSYVDIAHPDDRAQLKREMDETWGKPVNVDRQFRVVQRDGSIRWIRSRWFPILNAEGEVYRYCGLDIDTTDRVEQEEALRESQQQFEQLTSNIDDVFWIFDQEEDRTVFVSPIFRDLYGGMLGEDMEYLDIVHPDDKERVAAILEAGFADPKDSSDTFRVVRKDGTVRWINSRGFVVRNAEGEIYRYCGLNVDITERVEQEEALRTSEAEVRKALDNMEQANQDLRDAQTKLVQSEKMASLGNLVAGVAHEINTPIGAINSMHDTLMRGIEKLKDAIAENLPDALESNRSFQRPFKVIEEANRVIKTGTDRVTTIVRSLRSFARLDEAEKKEVPLSECLDDALTLVRHEVKGRVKIDKDYADLPPIVCYPSRLNQVFLNILVNAAQAIDGEGTIRIRTFAQEGDFVRIEITDDGPGIDAENLNQIFDPGFTTKGVGVGTGLGLSICYQIVQDHKGSIRADSEVGSGTTFLIDLPRAADEAS